MRRLIVFAPALVAALIFFAVLLAEGGDQEPGFSVSTLARAVTLGCLLASVLAAVVPKRADVRRHASVTLAVFAVTAVGQSRMNPVPAVTFQVGCAVLALVVVATLRAPHRWARTAAARRPVPTKGRAGAVFVLTLAWAAVAAVLSTQLPRASRVVERRVALYFDGYQAPEDYVGFSSNLQLGSTRGMLKSSKVVMRIDGQPVDYLRGAVHDEYDARHQRWSSSLDKLRSVVPAATPQEMTTTRIRVARGARVAGGLEARWFLPVGACDLRTESRRLTVDRGGVAHPDPATLANEIAFRSGPGCGAGEGGRGLADALAPSVRDLALTPDLRAELLPIAERWTSGLSADRAKLDAIGRQLRRFGYSLEVERTRDVDAVIDLLTIHREGHCELFASAMALLARTQGIPTRIASGYRVSEVNPVTGLSIVRERNAHTWIEAWVDGRWEIWDPTPAVEMAARTHVSGWDDASELAAWLWDRTVTTFWQVGLARIGLGAGASAIVLLGVRRLMQRGTKSGGADLVMSGRPLPAFEGLAAALERAGWTRTASEPLERFARRVDDGAEPWCADVADALVRYAEHRYGGRGEERLIAERLEALTRRIRPLA